MNTTNKQLVTSDLAAVASVLNENNVQLYTFDHSMFYDTDEAQRNLNDFKNEVIDRALFLENYIVIFENEELKAAPFYKRYMLQKMKKQALYELCEQYDILGYYHSEYEIEDNTKSSLIDELLNCISNEVYYTHLYKESFFRDLSCNLHVTGYSQGDIIKVALIGKCENYLTYQYFEDLYFNTPVYSRFEIFLNGALHFEFSMWDIENYSSYNSYDKQDTIDSIASYLSDDVPYKALFLEYLDNNLPSDLKYL